MKYHYAVFCNAKMVGVFETQSTAKDFIESSLAKAGNKEEEEFLNHVEKMKEGVIKLGWDKWFNSSGWSNLCAAGQKLDRKPKFVIKRVTVYENVGEAHT